jgi:hypothetical protein
VVAGGLLTNASVQLGDAADEAWWGWSFAADRADLLWHHRTTGELYVWYLDGLVEAGGSYLTPSTYTDSTWQIVPR